MRAVLCFYQFWGLCFHCCGVPNSQKQWLNSLTPRISPLSASKNIPWLVHVAETCQGIILNRWWILSTASCLIKLKLLPSDILGTTGKQDILFGQKICLYPTFNPRVSTDPVKGNIGVVLLQYPVRREEMPLSHTYNIFQKSCYNYQYRNCRVYQYQNHNTFGTSIKNLSVKLLDLSSCHHQHLHLTQSKKLCIWSQAQEDCRVQHGSPVLCLSGNHWGLVGLVSGSSMACYDPILVIKTALYLPWMRRFIKACQKPLGSTFSLPCCFSPGVEHGPQNGLSLNRGSTIWTSHGLTILSYGGRLGTLPLNRQRRDRPPVFFGSNNRDSFPGSRHLHLQSSQLSSASRLPMVKPWTSPIAKPWDPSEIANPWSMAVAGTSEPWVLSDPQHPPTADIPVSRDLVQEDAMKYQYRTVTNSTRSWVKTLPGLTGLHSLPVVNAGESWVLFSSGIEGSQVSSEITAVQAHVQSTKFPLHGQLRDRPWLDFIPDGGYTVQENIGTVMQNQASVENMRTQMYHVANKVNHVVKPVTYNVHLQVPLIVNKIRLRSHSTLIANRYHYPTVAQTLGPWFQPLLHIVGSQEPIEKKDEYSMLPESKSTQFWTSSVLNMPFTLSPSAANAIRSWEQYKASMIRPSSQMDRIGLQSKHETIIFQPQRKTEDAIESFAHSAVDIITPRTQTEADVIQTWTQSENQAGRLLTPLKADTIRPSLQTQAERIGPWIQTKFQIVRLTTHMEEGKDKHWAQQEADTITSWTSTDIETIRSWKQQEANIAGSWFWINSDQMRPITQPDFKTLHPWIQSELNTVRLWWTQSEAGGTQPWAKPEASTFRFRTQSRVNTVTHWTRPEANAVRLWLQTQNDIIRNSIQPDSQTVISSPEPGDDIVRSWLHTQVHTFKTWTENELQRTHTWTQPESAIVRPGTQSETDNVQLWFQTQMETVTLWTEPVTKIDHHWTRSEMEIVSPWNQHVEDNVRALIHLDTYAVRPWAELEGDKVRFWTQAEADIIRPWIQPDVGITNPGAHNDAGTLTLSTETKSHKVNAWKQSESKTVTPLIQDEIPAGNHWREMLANTVTTWAKTVFLGQEPLTHLASDTVTVWTKAESPTINPWTQPKADSIVQWTQSKPPSVSLREQTVSDAVASCTQAEFPKLETWTDPLTDIVTLWTQTESPVIPWTQSTASTVTSWSQPEPIAVSSCTHSVTDNVTSWTMFKTESKEPWTLPEASIFSISLHPQSDTTRSLTKVENQASLLWTHPEIDNVKAWASSESGTHMSWIVHLPQAARLWAQPEAVISRSWFKSQTEKIKLWDQSESQRVVSTMNQVGAGRADPVAKHETATILSWIQTKTGVFLPWNVSEGDRVRSWILSKADIIRPWVKTEDSIINSLTHSNSSTFRVWTQGESAAVRPWRPPEANTFTLLTQEEMRAEKHLTLSDINMVRPWFQTQIGATRQGTQSESQTVTTWIQPEWQTAHPWIQQESNAVTFRAHPEGDLAELWIEAESNTATLWTHYETDILKPWTQPESQFVSSWTEVATATFWYSMQNDAIRPSYQLEPQMTCSMTQNQVGIVSPWIQYECNSVRSWAKPETATVQPWIHLAAATIRPWSQAETWGINPSGQADADSVRRHWFQSQIDSVKPLRSPDANTVIPWTQPKTQTLPIWTKTEKQVVKPVALSEVDTITPWLQTRSYTTRPWIQPDSWAGSPWTPSKVGIARSWTQQTGDTNQPWTYPETQPVKPWINLEADTVRSWFQIQRNKVRPQTNSVSQGFSHWFQPEAPTVTSWMQPETQEGRLWAHSKTEIIASSAIVKTHKVRKWIQPEIEMKPGSLYKADAITSFAPLETQPEAATPLSIRFGSWSERVPFLQMETIPSPQQYFITALPTEITASESQSQINPLQPSELTDILLLTLSSTWLPERVGFLNFGRALQMTKIKGSSDVPSDSPSPLSPSFSFLVPCSLPSPWTLSPSCSVFVSCTFPSTCIFPSHSILSPMAFTPVLFPLGSLVSSLQELSSSNFTEEAFLSHAFTSLLAAPATVLTKQPYLVPVSQSESKSNQSEQDPLKYPELNISLAECRLGLLWRESLQGFWLFKTAVISHETTVCGLRPGLVPHCPNCWKAEVGEFPWMVSVQLSFNHFCAGSILNKQWILTTARCANFIKYSEAWAQVQVGLIDLQHPAQAQTAGIHRAMPYLGPKGPLGPGLIFLKQPLHFQPLVLPICLEDNLEQEKNIQFDDCWLPSWSFMRGSPRILQKKHLNILKVSTCARFWPQQNEFTFCIEAKKAMGEAGCKGDLGAPLVCHLQQKDTWVQVGILTHFDEHCTKPYVFSQVSPFLFWLQGVTQPSHAPWSQEGPMTTSASTPLSVSTSTNASAVASTPASIRPHFISLPHPQTLADRISLRYAMPWQAMIISCGRHICSGSIVSSSWVLTAAHCVRDMNPEDTAVILGLRHPGAPLRVVKVSSILLHERFRLVTGAARNDLALMLLQEVQTPIQLLAPLGHLRNLNSSECWLSGPRILKQGETDENPEMLQIHVMGISSCAHLYPDVGSFVVCFMTESNGSDANVEPVSPGSAVMCRPMSGNGSWRQIGFTSLQDLATIVSPHFSWILSTSAKAGHPINQALMPWVEKPNSSGLLKQTPTLSLSSIAMIALHRHL